MSPATKQLLKHFAAKANWITAGNSADTDRFFDFVIAAYRAGEHDISRDDILAIVRPKSDGDESNVSVVKKEKESRSSDVHVSIND